MPRPCRNCGIEVDQLDYDRDEVYRLARAAGLPRERLIEEACGWARDGRRCAVCGETIGHGALTVGGDRGPSHITCLLPNAVFPWTDPNWRPPKKDYILELFGPELPKRPVVVVCSWMDPDNRRTRTQRYDYLTYGEAFAYHRHTVPAELINQLFGAAHRCTYDGVTYTLEDPQ